MIVTDPPDQGAKGDEPDMSGTGHIHGMDAVSQFSDPALAYGFFEHSSPGFPTSLHGEYFDHPPETV